MDDFDYTELQDAKIALAYEISEYVNAGSNEYYVVSRITELIDIMISRANKNPLNLSE